MHPHVFWHGLLLLELKKAYDDEAVGVVKP